MTRTRPAISDVHVLDADRLRAAYDLFGAALHRGVAPDQRWDTARGLYEPGRTFGVYDGELLVGTAMSFATGTAVPGGAVLPTAAVSRVGVRADHTRRGVLTALVGRQLAAVADAGEVLASLRASEAPIYGRFGYGVASRGQNLRVRRRGSGWRAAAPTGGAVRVLEPGEVLDVLRPLHRRLAHLRAGGITRTDAWWELSVGRALADHDHLVVAVHTGPDGDDGFLAASARGGERFGEDTLVVSDLHAAGPAAVAGLWRFALGLDLVAVVEGRLRPLDEPLDLLLADPRDVEVTGVDDETWLRVVDVPAALAARRFAPAGPVLLEVRDRLLPANDGVYRIADGAAERVGDPGGPVRAELECDPAGLAMAYLGDRAPSALVATGWWRAVDPAAVARADQAFHTGSAPWSGTFF